MTVKNYEYEIKSSPDPLNPNEQSAGTEIEDDRLYGMDKIIIAYQGQSYNKESFNKPFLSNRLALSIIGQNFSVGQIITLTGTQSFE